MVTNITKLYVYKNKDKYGIKRYSDNELILPLEYDNILKIVDFYIFVKNGKMGLSKTKTNEDNTYSLETIVNCEYDYIEIGGVNTFLLHHKKGEQYYNINKNKLSGFYKSLFTLQLNNYIQAHTKDKFYLIDKQTDETICEIENDFKKGYFLLEELGKTKEGNAVFIQVQPSIHHLLYKSESGYKFLEDYIVRDWITNKNGINIVNIVEGINGIGLVDGNGNFLTDTYYDSIQADINISLSTFKGEDIEKTISCGRCYRKYFGYDEIDDLSIQGLRD